MWITCYSDKKYDFYPKKLWVQGFVAVDVDYLVVAGGGGGGSRSGSPPATTSTGGAGGSGIVIVKELNKASGSWPLRAQFQARKQGTWVQGFVAVDVDYLVVAGGGGGGGACSLVGAGKV